MDHYNEPIKPSRPERKIEQLTHGTGGRLYALCNDKTVWSLNPHGIWYPEAAIPQPKDSNR